MSEPIRTRNSYDGLNNRPVHYPDLPEPLEVGTYDNHTHLDIEDGDEPLSVNGLQILIEKDFDCVAPRAGEAGIDTFPNEAENSNLKHLLMWLTMWNLE